MPPATPSPPITSPSFLIVTLPSAATIGNEAPGSEDSWEKNTGWASCHFLSMFPGRPITAAVYALARAMSGVSGRAPSARRMPTGNPPGSTTATLTALPAAWPRSRAAATMVSAS